MEDTSFDNVGASETYPKGNMISDDGILTVPFNLLAGEGGQFRGRTSEGVLIITNYRLFHNEGTFFNIPLGVIDYIENRDIFYLYIYCKDGRTFRCIFDNNEYAQIWLKRIQNVTKSPVEPHEHFGFGYFSWTVLEQHKEGNAVHPLCDLKHSPAYDVDKEMSRMGFDPNVWKVSNINVDYELCPSYPKSIIVPTSVTDQNLKVTAYFRYSKRIPVVVYRHQKNGCVIARSSQPKLGLWGIWGWRDKDDEMLITAILHGCMSDPGDEMKIEDRQEPESLRNVIDGELSILYGEQNKHGGKKLLIVDARSYAAAMTNRAKGGGYESNVYYPNCEMQFMGLANIHTIRNSFASVRALCAQPDDPNWLSSLENTKWLHHISGIIRAALLVVNAVDIEQQPVLVHCSDGWDRTPQIVALAELMLDPYYRTKKGFQVLVEKEWLEFGHKFADRCGNSDGTEDRNERSPVFLQWLDCVYQLLQQFDCEFEFNDQYLARLAVHTYSNLFGDFFFNNDQSRRRYCISQRTFSIWPLLNQKGHFHNYLYKSNNKVLRPSFQIRNMEFWQDVYLADNTPQSDKLSVFEEENSEKTNLVKTKSCDNITSENPTQNLVRHNSNPDLGEIEYHNEINVTQLPELTYNVERSTTPEENIQPLEDLHLENESDELYETGIEDLQEEPPERTEISDNDNLYPMLLLKEHTPINGSTDTLVSNEAAEALIKFEKCLDEVLADGICNSLKSFKPYCSVSTSTSDLLTVENVMHFSDVVKYWNQSNLQACFLSKRNSNGSNSYNCSYTTPNHSRTPSSGFPATPCDDPNEMECLKNQALLEVDGLNIVSIPVQERVKRIILHYKNGISSLELELNYTKRQLSILKRRLEGRNSQTADTEDAPLPDFAYNGEQQPDSGGSESSWEMISKENVTTSKNA